MTVPTVFVGSSSEALTVVEAASVLLENALGGEADVKPWSEAFGLTMTYIGSLENLVNSLDFAVLVLTPDDVTKSRKVESRSPRDNVVFEVGLFFGALGRERCFLLQDRDSELKLPSDLLGIESAGFSKRDLDSTLGPACDRVGKAILDAMARLPSRPKLSAAEREVKKDLRRFADKITGTWWERIQLRDERPALSFLSIQPDEAQGSVRFEGTAYAADGRLVANWASEAVRLLGRQEVVYLRQCGRLDTADDGLRRGSGHLTFVESGEVIDRGHGRFWESEGAYAEDTVIKKVELHRISDKREELTMRTKSDREKNALIREVLGAWRTR